MKISFLLMTDLGRPWPNASISRVAATARLAEIPIAVIDSPDGKILNLEGTASEARFVKALIRREGQRVRILEKE